MSTSLSAGRRARTCTLVVALFLNACFWCGTATAQSAHAPRSGPLLVSEHPCPDPQVFNDGADWYVFGTGAKPFFLQGSEFGEGKMRKVELQLDYGDFPLKVEHVWGFVVHRHTDGTHHGYGTLHLGSFRTVIGYFEPRETERWERGKPIAKWRLKNIVVGNPARQDWNYYESKVLEDTDGSRYLMYVARTGRDNYMYARKLKAWGQLDPTAKPRVMLQPDGHRSEDRNGPGSMQLVEGGSIFKWRGKYILFYSVGDFVLNNYKLGVAFSDTLIPPAGQTYRKIKLPDPERVWGASHLRTDVGYLLQSEKPEWPNYSGRVVVGPGLGSIVMIDHQPWLFFHGYKPDDRERRPENRFVFRVPVALEFDGDSPTLNWIRAGIPTPAGKH